MELKTLKEQKAALEKTISEIVKEIGDEELFRKNISIKRTELTSELQNVRKKLHQLFTTVLTEIKATTNIEDGLPAEIEKSLIPEINKCYSDFNSAVISVNLSAHKLAELERKKNHLDRLSNSEARIEADLREKKLIENKILELQEKNEILSERLEKEKDTLAVEGYRVLFDKYKIEIRQLRKEIEPDNNGIQPTDSEY